MRLPTRSAPPAEASLTPMIDVVFLLIIFFLVSSHLARRENHLPVELPVASTAPPPDPDHRPLVVTVGADASISVSGKTVPSDSLAPIFAAWTQRADVTPALRIRADGGAAYADVEPILRAAANSGLTNASIAVVEDNTTRGGER